MHRHREGILEIRVFKSTAAEAWQEACTGQKKKPPVSVAAGGGYGQNPAQLGFLTLADHLL